MKNTKENVIKLLKKESDVAWNLAKHYKEAGKMDSHKRELREINTITHIINLLEDNEYFEIINNIYNK